MIVNRILNILMNFQNNTKNNPRRLIVDDARETYENLSAIEYAEAAQRYEMCLAKYLSKHDLAYGAVTNALEFYAKEYPIAKNLHAYGETSSVESGAVGQDEKKVESILKMGNLREKMSMLCHFSSFVIDHKEALRNKDNVGKIFTKEETYGFSDRLIAESGFDFYRSDRVKKIQDVVPHAGNVDQRFRLLKCKEHILGDIPQGIRTSREARYFFDENPNFAESLKRIYGELAIKDYIRILENIEETEMKIRNEHDDITKQKLKEKKKELKGSIKDIDERIRKRLKPGSLLVDFKPGSKVVADFNDRGMNLVAGPSGSVRTIYIVAKLLGLPTNLYLGLRLAILSMFIMERHHSFHEVMMVTHKMFGMPYTDTDKRYRYIDPLTEDELRKNITENKYYYAGHSEWKGKFPDEVGKSIANFDAKKKFPPLSE